MLNKNKKIVFYFIAPILFLLDQSLKWQALHNWNTSHLINKYFGWQPFLNSGIAFGIPLPSWLIILITIPIIFLLIYLLIKNKNIFYTVAYLLIILGAISNLADRLLYNNTVDYLQILTGVINLGDVMIVFGFVIYICNLKKLNSKDKNYVF
ncbi:MAG: Lipoprotein signal peptidase [Candidatus Magasanikbacteria bacterium GW2011_GWC2_34_16]|uniref:Lipoprotein signal peptidase n=1 Tax=Candidatus Magasanikbacteria bacterium GW2011_GWC2_34_16 TaxID=1619045 RepID=A0A0G0DWJ8_9BACT|nr:MAG: Lipoprotein signal peptidase [Candidatus Magasanikbacteria bacterium GW2011_GWC2_34_16]